MYTYNWETYGPLVTNSLTDVSSTRWQYKHWKWNAPSGVFACAYDINMRRGWKTIYDLMRAEHKAKKNKFHLLHSEERQLNFEFLFMYAWNLTSYFNDICRMMKFLMVRYIVWKNAFPIFLFIIKIYSQGKYFISERKGAVEFKGFFSPHLKIYALLLLFCKHRFKKVLSCTFYS